jgi:hypothetical protein
VGLHAGRGRKMRRPRHRSSSGDVWDEGWACPLSCLRWSSDYGEGIERRVASSPSPQHLVILTASIYGYQPHINHDKTKNHFNSLKSLYPYLIGLTLQLLFIFFQKYYKHYSEQWLANTSHHKYIISFISIFFHCAKITNSRVEKHFRLLCTTKLTTQHML